MPTVTPTKLREAFFTYLFEDREGYVCIAHADRGDPPKMKKSFSQTFFKWPEMKKELSAFIDQNAMYKHLWYAVNQFEKPERKTEYALAGSIVYADLDACDPNTVDPLPSLAYESSPGRFQAIWQLQEIVSPDIRADYSRRLAYKYSVNGADKTGWDITQLLRIPFTKNYKYASAPEIKVILNNDETFHVETFEEIEAPPDAVSQNGDVADMPALDTLPDSDKVIARYERELRKTDVLKWYDTEPEPGDDWSGIMWRLINTLIEADMNEEEVFSVVLNSKCNKYERDKRPVHYLWREVLKAFRSQQKLGVLVEQFAPLKMPDILPSEPVSETVIDKYMEWASEATDAVPIFHELSAFIVLSTLLSSTIELEVSYGTVIPNIWALILGESTLTRKTTAMTLARNLIAHIDEDTEIASEGSVEGILQGLSLRPGLASMFYRDEVSGFFDAINKKDYLAGMTEVFTLLYDVPRIFRRLLKKDTVVVERPIFIFYGGGIRDEVYSKLNADNILSGFLPRFLVVSGETDMARIRPTSRYGTENLNKKKAIYDAMADIYETYQAMRPMKIAGQTIDRTATIRAELTDNAWDRYQQIETAFTQQAYNSSVSNYALPTYERLSRSMLKMALLLGAARQEPNDLRYVVDVEDIDNAAYYVRRWGVYSIDVINNIGKSSQTRISDRIRMAIEKNPGIQHSILMRNTHLSKREMDAVIETLIDRGEIRKLKKGGIRYWPK
jgi:hypothetical protein